MPDITMCLNETCPAAWRCYRSEKSGTKLSGERQSWGLYVVGDSEVYPCPMFVPVSDASHAGVTNRSRD